MESINKQFHNRIPYFIRVMQQYPSAVAEINGSPDYPGIKGRIYFYQTRYGVLTASQVFGLPVPDSVCERRIFAFHIHEGTSCTGNRSDAFANTLTHYNPDGCDHPNHAGDLLPLWGNDGYAFELFLTDRFSVDEVIGKTLIIHLDPDDFTTQPSGNAGEKIACGIIERYLPWRRPNTR